MGWRGLSIARRAYATLNPVWRSKMYSKHTKLKILKSCVTSVLLYGAEMWWITSTDIEQLDVFHRKCLRRILGIFWPHTISNCDLYERPKERPISETVKVRRWTWIGHILRREKDNNCRVALTRTPEGKRKRGRPKISWRRTVEGERKDLGWTSWNEVEQRAKDRDGWRTFLGSLMLQSEERRG
ncbi:uncharacterized protein LOC144637177 [Oculina patagonica]